MPGQNQENSIIGWCLRNPENLHARYSDELSDEHVQLILDGQLDEFFHSVHKACGAVEVSPGFWDAWEEQFADAFGYDDFSDMPELMQSQAKEHRLIDVKGYIKEVCENTKPKVVALLERQDGEFIYAPNMSIYGRSDQKLAAYIRNTFGMQGTPSQVGYRIGAPHGGESFECAIAVGTVDVDMLIESKTAPSKVRVGPQDEQNLIFFDSWSGYAHTGLVSIDRERVFPAQFRVDSLSDHSAQQACKFGSAVWRRNLVITE